MYYRMETNVNQLFRRNRKQRYTTMKDNEMQAPCKIKDEAESDDIDDEYDQHLIGDDPEDIC